jgi:chromosome segregation ATPase
VEERLLKALKDWLKSYKAQWKDKRPQTQRNDQAKIKAYEEVLKSLQKKLDELDTQKNELHDLLERRIYTTEVFLERSHILTQRIDETKTAITRTELELELERKRIAAKVETIPKVEHVLEVYHKTEDPAKKNALLRSVLEYATYRKEKGGRWNPDAMDRFTLSLFPKLPKG